MIAARDARRLKFSDESGVNLTMARRYGRAPKGARVVGSVPQNDGPTVTMRGALGAHGLPAVMTVDGPLDPAVFRASSKPGLGPTLTPGDIVVLDTWGGPNARGIQPAARPVAVSAARLAGPGAPRALWVDGQNGAAPSQRTHPRRSRQRDHQRPADRDGS